MKIQTVLWCIGVVSCMVGAKPIHIRKADVSQQALPIYVGWVGEKTQLQERLCQRFMACIGHSGQFVPSCEWLSRMPKVRGKIRDLFRSGYTLAVFIGNNADKLEWRLYDVLDGRMITGRSFPACNHERLWVYSAAHELWNALTGQVSPFLSHITYVKKVKHNSGHTYQLCLADFDGSHEYVIYTSPRYIMSPQWGEIEGKPVIFFSEFTRHNVRICITDTRGNARPLFDLDGTAVGCVPCHDEIIYCRSGVIWRCRYDAQRNKRIHIPVIKAEGVCASPSVDEAGNIFYCHRGMIKHFDRKQGVSKAILYNGYYVAPSYHVDQQSLVYAQRIQGVMQLCVYRCNNKQTRQLTYDAGDKYDPRWSPCGRYIVYANSQDGCVYTYNIATDTQFRVTSPHEVCSSPAWSPMKVYVV